MRALTVEEARQRAADLDLRSYEVAFDLTGPGDTFLTTSRIRFGAASSTSWVDVKPERLISVVLNGQSLDVGDRTLSAFRPPLFDSPTTTGFIDSKSGSMFTSDCFGAPMPSLDLAVGGDVRAAGSVRLRYPAVPIGRTIFPKSLTSTGLATRSRVCGQR